MAEHLFILKNNQNTYCPRFSFTPKTGTEVSETGVLTVSPIPVLGMKIKQGKQRNLVIFGALITIQYQ